MKNKATELIAAGKTKEAIAMLDKEIATVQGCRDDELFYLRGNAYRKEANWQQALNNYLEAINLNSKSPAVEAHRMLMDILEFFNKDMYNQ